MVKKASLIKEDIIIKSFKDITTPFLNYINTIIELSHNLFTSADYDAQIAGELFFEKIFLFFDNHSPKVHLKYYIRL